MTTHDPFRAQVAGLAAMGVVTIRGQEFKGEYLSTMVAVNPQTPGTEAARTSQLISEFGRLTAAALKEHQMAQVRYRQWRSQTVTELTTDLEACVNQGLLADDAKKPLSKTAAEEALKQLPEYEEHYELMTAAEEAHGVLYAAYEAAKSRQYAIRAFEASGATDTRGSTGNYSDPAPEPDGDPSVFHGGHGDDATETLESQAGGGARTPLPAPAGPPGPPPSAAPAAKTAPPPPPASGS